MARVKRGVMGVPSGSGNAHNVGQKSEKRKTRSPSWEKEVPASRSVRARTDVDSFVPGPQPNETVQEPEVFSINQGPGTKLQDIPNVVLKLSERTGDKNLQVLHTILYGRKSTVCFWKKNILQFSGFVWAENEEKERAKVKERIDKCNKERLLLLCQLLDIPDMKVTTKKEVVSAKLLEFLEFPHVTKSVVRAENVERSRKQKSIKESGQKVYGKGKAKVSGEPPPEPTEKEVRKFIIDWAKGIDFVKSVMGDLFRRLEDHFKMDLCDRKEELKHILTDIIFEEDDQDDDTDDSGGEDASRSGEDAGQKDAEGSDEDAGGEEDAEGSDEDAGEEEDAEGPSEDAGEEEGAEGSSEDAGEDEDPEGSDEDAGEEEDAEGSSEAGEEECAEGSSEDAGE